MLKIKVSFLLTSSVKLSVIPAPGGMLGIGGGFLIADLKKNGIEVKKVKTPKLEN